MRRRVAGMAALALIGLGAARAGAQPAADSSFTIEQCMARARVAGPAVPPAKFESEAARQDFLAATLNRRPSFSLVGGVLVAPSGWYDPIVTNLGEYHAQARVDWPLADGGARRRERSRAELALDHADLATVAAARDAAVSAAQAAIDLLRLAEGIELREGTLAWVDRLARRMAEGVRAGAHGRGDEQRVQLARDGIGADLLALRENVETARRALRRQLGLAPSGGWSVAAPADAEDRAPARADSVALMNAMVAAPEVRDAFLDAAGRRIDAEEARRRNALETDLTADAGLLGSDLTRLIPDDLRASTPGATFEDRLRRDLGASIGIELKRPLLDASRARRVAARERAAEGGELRAAAVRSEREQFGYDLLTHWRVAAARLDSARASADRAERHVLRLESLFAGGAASLLELLDARQVLDDALGRAADARADLRRARYEAEAQ